MSTFGPSAFSRIVSYRLASARLLTYWGAWVRGRRNVNYFERHAVYHELKIAYPPPLTPPPPPPPPPPPRTHTKTVFQILSIIHTTKVSPFLCSSLTISNSDIPGDFLCSAASSISPTSGVPGKGTFKGFGMSADRSCDVCSNSVTSATPEVWLDDNN